MANKTKLRTSQAEHHRHLKKRSKTFYSNRSKRVIDHLVFFAGPLIPVAIAPTAWDVIINGQTEGINLMTWGTLTLTSLIMALYAYIHKEIPLMVTYTPLVILNTIVVLGVILK